MSKYERIVDIEREWQAQIIDEELQRRNIPHMMRSHRDSALDGLLQSPGGWGHIEAPLEFKDDIIRIVEDLRNQPPVEKGDSETSEEDIEETKGKIKGRTMLILLVAGFALVGSLALHNWYIRSHYVETIGCVISIREQPTAMLNNVDLTHPSRVDGLHLVINYSVGRVEVLGEVDVSKMHIRKGDLVPVLYSKEQPSHCMLK